MRDIDMERRLVEENSAVEADEQTVEEEHAEAQRTGEVFEGVQNGGDL